MEEALMRADLVLNTPEKLFKDGPKPVSIERRFWPKVIIIEEGCWGWDGSKHKFGYGKIGKGGKYGGWMCAHVLSWLIHFGDIPEGLHVCHKCDNPECCRPDHLFLGTHKQNMEDAKRKGRSGRPERKYSIELMRSVVSDPLFGTVGFFANKSRELGVNYGGFWNAVKSFMKKESA